jgi:DedD protein
MGLFSFGSKDDAPSGRDAYSDSSRGSRQTVRTERRTRRSDRPDADAMMLDPTLPEKQRARRRLVGAIALVAAAVIILPMVLDSHPKPVTDDISINIPTRPAPPLPKASQAPADTMAGVAPDEGPATASDSTVATPVVPAVKPSGQAKAEPVPKPVAPPVSDVTPPAAAVTQAPKPASAAASSVVKPNTPTSPGGSRFVIQIGTFDDDAAAQNWVSKLKAAGVPAYTEHRKQADGSMQTLLRAGPFTDRAAASAALGKVRQAGLGGGKAPAN